MGVTTVKRRSLGPVVDIEVKQQARGYTPVPVYTGSIRAGGEIYAFSQYGSLHFYCFREFLI